MMKKDDRKKIGLKNQGRLLFSPSAHHHLLTQKAGIYIPERKKREESSTSDRSSGACLKGLSTPRTCGNVGPLNKKKITYSAKTFLVSIFWPSIFMV
jgi:hypothetical protein